jgi:hypothetical protein
MTEITFHNKAEIRVQAQIFAGNLLVSTCVAGPGETNKMPVESARYDIYLKNGISGWQVASMLDSEARNLTLRKDNGRYVITTA